MGLSKGLALSAVVVARVPASPQFPAPTSADHTVVDTDERQSHHRRRRMRPSYSVMASVADHDFSGARNAQAIVCRCRRIRGFVGGSLQAHHSLAGVYDLKKVERATGVVQKFAFTNPHGALHIAIKNAQGEVKVWQLTTGSANVLVNAGLSATGPNRIKSGDELTVTFNPAVSGASIGFLRSMILPDSKKEVEFVPN
jgi:hypothetical protein